MNFKRFQPPPNLLSLMSGADVPVKDIEVWATDTDVHILKSIDKTPKWDWLLHVSISRTDRNPTWEEIQECKEKFFGDTDVMMILPKKEDYVNVHQHCFHLWKTPQSWELM